jgi:hypothetical protein
MDQSNPVPDKGHHLPPNSLGYYYQDPNNPGCCAKENLERSPWHYEMLICKVCGRMWRKTVKGLRTHKDAVFSEPDPFEEKAIDSKSE